MPEQTVRIGWCKGPHCVDCAAWDSAGEDMSSSNLHRCRRWSPHSSNGAGADWPWTTAGDGCFDHIPITKEGEVKDA